MTIIRMTALALTAALTLAASGTALAQTEPDDAPAPDPASEEHVLPAPDPASDGLTHEERVSLLPAPDPEVDLLRFWLGAAAVMYGDGDKRPERSGDKVIGGVLGELELQINMAPHVALALQANIGGGGLAGAPALMFGGNVGVHYRTTMDTFRLGLYVGGASSRNGSDQTTTSEFRVLAEVGVRTGDTLSDSMFLVRAGYDMVFNELGNVFHTPIVFLLWKHQIDLGF